MMLSDLLHQLEQILIQIDYIVLKRMQKGLEPAIVKAILSKNGVYSEKLVNLYQWKNGNPPDPEENVIEKLELFPEGIMLSIEEALTTYKFYTGVESSWETGLFPIFANGGGCYLLLDIRPAAETSGMVLLYDPVPVSSEEIVTIYDSIDLLFESVIACIGKGVYQYQADGTIDLDFDLREEVCAGLNPKSAYWKET